MARSPRTKARKRARALRAAHWLALVPNEPPTLDVREVRASLANCRSGGPLSGPLAALARGRSLHQPERLAQLVMATRPERDQLNALATLSEMPWERGLTERPLPALIPHLLGRYPLPTWAGNAWREGGRALHLVRWLGVGGSAREAFRRRLLRLPLTRRQLHLWLTEAPAALEPTRAARWAQLTDIGFDGEVRDRLLERFQEPTTAERWWPQAWAWLAAHPMDALEATLDWLASRPDLTGRTAASARRARDRWIARRDRPRFHTVRSGLPDIQWTVEGQRWSMVELTSSTALELEGRMQRHCVAAYGGQVRSGHCSIWSLRRGPDRTLTVEVRSRRVVQARGRLNRAPLVHELHALRRWAGQVGVGVHGSIRVAR